MLILRANKEISPILIHKLMLLEVISKCSIIPYVIIYDLKLIVPLIVICVNRYSIVFITFQQWKLLFKSAWVGVRIVIDTEFSNSSLL